MVIDKQQTFKGLGKLKGREIKLQLKPDVLPVAQPVRRIPFSLRAKVEVKIQELIDKDVIEPVEEPTSWVSLEVVVPKANGDVWLCDDLRCVNKATIPMRHPIPRMEELLHDTSCSRVFSKLDLKWGNHQIELHPESWNVTTFVTHCRLYRYKRLPFGVNAASEIHQHEIQKIIQGIPAVANISDDIIIHSENVEEHEKPLRQVLERIESTGLTLNEEKCLICKPELTFAGHHLSSKGINLTKDTTRAVENAREPKNPTEVRSFLGLVN